MGEAGADYSEVSKFFPVASISVTFNGNAPKSEM